MSRQAVRRLVLGALLLAAALVFWGSREHKRSTMNVGRLSTTHPTPASPQHPARLESANTVTALRGSISGVVVDAGSRVPVTGARICATRPLDAASTCAATDEHGRYALELPLGTYWVHVHGDALVSTGCRPEGLGLVALTRATPQRSVLLQTVAASGLIEGVVRDRFGGTVEGATVRSLFAGVPGAEFELCTLATSDDAGRFRIPVAGDLHVLRGEADSYGLGISELVEPGDFTEIVLVPEATIVGRVVRQGSESPVAGATVCALLDDAEGRITAAAASTDENGRYELRGLTSAAYFVEASAPGLYGAVAHDVRVEPGDQRDVLISVSTAGSLSGVFMLDDSPCPQGHLSLSHTSLGLEFASSVSDGVAIIEGLPRGRYEARASCHDRLLVDGPATVDVADTKGPTSARWMFSHGGTIRGTVYSSGGRAPAVGVSVFALARARDGYDARSVLTDHTGSFWLTGLHDGVYEVGVRFGETATIAVDGGAEEHLELELDAVRSVHGTALDRDGRACRAYEVRAMHEGAFVATRVDPLGRFLLPNMPAGSDSLALLDLDGAVVDSVVADADGDGALQAALTCPPRNGVLRGAVLDAEGEAIAEALLEAVPVDAGGAPHFETTSARVISDVDGAFQLDELSPGSYLVVASTASGRELGRVLGETGTEVEIRALRRCSISGEVELGPSLQGPLSVRVHSGERIDSGSVLIDESDPHWILGGLLPGSYVVTASAASGETTTQAVGVTSDCETAPIVLQL